MPELASIFQRPRLGVEVTPGTAVAANRLLQATGIMPGIKPEMQRFRAQGMKYATVNVPGKLWTEAGVDGAVSYVEEVYPLSSIIRQTTPVANGASAWDWTFDSDTDGPDTGKTYTIEMGSADRAIKFAYAYFQDLVYKFSRAGVTKEGKIVGRDITDDVVVTVGPTEVALVPIVPTQVDVILSDAAADLATDPALERAISAEWGLTGRFAPIWALNSSFASFAGVVEVEPKQTARLKMAADDAGMELYATLKAGATKFLRLQAVGPVIAGPVNYEFIIDAAVKVVNVSEFRDDEGLWAIEWEFEGTHDSTWGRAFQIKLTNALAAL